MSTTRRMFSQEFKAKVVLESLKEQVTLEVLARKNELTPTQISAWKSQALKNFGERLKLLKINSLYFHIQFLFRSSKKR